MPTLAPVPSHQKDLSPSDRQADSRLTPQHTPLDGSGPQTNRNEARRSIYQMLTDRLRGITQPIEKALSQHETEQTTDAQKQASENGLAKEPEKTGIVNRLANHLMKFSEIRSLRDLVSWSTGLITETCQALVYLARPLPKPVIAPQPKATPSHIDLTPTHSSTISHTYIIEPRTHERIEFELSTKATKDITAEALATVAEATRKEHVHEQKIIETQQEEIRRKKDNVRAAIQRIDTEGCINADLSAILAQFDGTYGSAEVALRQIAAAQLKEKKKV